MDIQNLVYKFLDVSGTGIAAAVLLMCIYIALCIVTGSVACRF